MIRYVSLGPRYKPDYSAPQRSFGLACQTLEVGMAQVRGGGGSICSFGEQAAMDKGTCMYDGSKFHKIVSQILVISFLFFDPKFSKPLFLAISNQKFDKSSESKELNRHAIAQNDHNTILLK